MNTLHNKTLDLLSRPDFDTVSKASEETRTEARVNLLSMARAVSASLIDLLTHSRGLVTTDKANQPAVEAQLHSTATDVNLMAVFTVLHIVKGINDFSSAL